MTDVLDYAPLAATTLAIPQFLPQIVRLRGTGDAAGLSWAWAMLTSLNNAAWIAYFALARYWSALVPAIAATLLAGLLALMLSRRGQAGVRSASVITGWAALLAAAGVLSGRAGLGTLLTAAFAVQVAPSLWTAYRTARPTGVSRATWLLILGELGCWLAYGVHESDPRLTVLGALGVTASLLMLARIRRVRRVRRVRQRGVTAPVGRGAPGRSQAAGQPRGSLTLAKSRTSGNGGWSPGFRST
jgi:uncharacterized protein with PQ loop repeat